MDEGNKTWNSVRACTDRGRGFHHNRVSPLPGKIAVRPGKLIDKHLRTKRDESKEWFRREDITCCLHRGGVVRTRRSPYEEAS